MWEIPRRADHKPYVFSLSEWANQHLILDFFPQPMGGKQGKRLCAQVMVYEEVTFAHGRIATSIEDQVWENGIKQEQKRKRIRVLRISLNPIIFFFFFFNVLVI